MCWVWTFDEYVFHRLNAIIAEGACRTLFVVGDFFPEFSYSVSTMMPWFCRGISESVVVDPVILPDSGVGFQGPGYVFTYLFYCILLSLSLPSSFTVTYSLKRALEPVKFYLPPLAQQGGIIKIGLVQSYKIYL